MASFGEGFSRAFAAQQQIGAQNRATTLNYESQKLDRQLRMRKAQMDQAKELQKRYDAAIKDAMAQIDNRVKEGAYDSARQQLAAITKIGEQFDQHTSNLAKQGLLINGSSFVTKLEAMGIGIGDVEERAQTDIDKTSAKARRAYGIEDPDIRRAVIEKEGLDPKAVKPAIAVKGDERLSVDLRDFKRVKQLMADGYLVIPPTITATSPEAFTASKKEFATLSEQKVAVQNFAQMARSTMDVINAQPSALAVGGKLSATVNNLAADLRSFAQAFGVRTDIIQSADKALRFESNQHYDPKTALPTDDIGKLAEPTFRSLGIANAALKSDIINLAFAAAAANGQTGRSVSDRDFEAALREIGAGSRDPDTFKFVLQRVANRMNNRYRNAFLAARDSGRFPNLVGQEPEDLIGNIFSEGKKATTGGTTRPTVPSSVPSGSLMSKDGKYYLPPGGSEWLSIQ